MLKNVHKRIIYSVALLAIIFPIFYITSYCGYPGRIVGSIFYVGVGMLGLYEAGVVMGMKKSTAMITSLVVLVFFVLDDSNNYMVKFIVRYGKNDTFARMIENSIFGPYQWIFIIVFMIIPYVIDKDFRQKTNLRNFVLWWLVIIIISIFSKMLFIVNIFDANYIYFFIFISIIADTMAYTGGMLFGKKLFKGAKFAPKISPSKTWTGFVFGFVSSAIFAVLGGYYMHIWQSYDSLELTVSIIFGLILAFISPFGDLLFSWIKRIHGKKDFSNLIPGHGGIFDRVDAMSVVVAVSSFLLLMSTI